MDTDTPLESATQSQDVAQSDTTASAERPATPPSRASTPSAPRKFSGMNVTKKFLSKAGAPTAAPSKPTSISPAPIASSSRLLSTKLTSVSHPSPSPNPPPPAPSASPWAKPAPPEPKKPAPNAPMGSGVVSMSAWKSVASDRPNRSLSRDFPTAKEVAEGKRAAAMAAQAQAAHNQAILQGLDAFTHIESSHRWDEEDDDDDVLDFAPVPQSERFVEDFDRTWREPRRVDERVLFNASSNKLEHAPIPRKPLKDAAPERVIYQREAPQRQLDRNFQERPERSALDGIAPERSQLLDRSQRLTTSERMLPPHMTESRLSDRIAPPRRSDEASVTRSADRVPPPKLLQERPTQIEARHADRPPLIPHPATTRRASTSIGPTSPTASPTVLPPAAQTATGTQGVDAQTAEMHTAAEKARLRRLAEEAEREAAAERARRKAKEMEARVAPPADPEPIVIMQREKTPPFTDDPSHLDRSPTSNFDNTLARLQAAMAKARLEPAPTSLVDVSADNISSTSSPSTIITSGAVSLAPRKINQIVYFDVTQPEPPRSPPPVWRTIVTKVPRNSISPSLRTIPKPSKPPIMTSFDPPLPSSSRDYLLPPPYPTAPPIVSVSHRTLPKFQRKPKKVYEMPRSDAILPTVSLESLLPPPKVDPSELEGDSLLDEVNKMSLETVDEGDRKSPATPPSGIASRQAGSPNGTPWSRTPNRDQQTVKNMWTSESVNSNYPTTNGFAAQSGLWSNSLGYQYKTTGSGYQPYGFRATPNNLNYSARPNRFSTDYTGFDGYYGGVVSLPQNGNDTTQDPHRPQPLPTPSRPYPIKKMW